MDIVNTDVVYVDEEDLFLQSRNKNIDNINCPDVKNNEVIKKSTVIIYRNRKNQYKVLKSRW